MQRRLVCLAVGVAVLAAACGNSSTASSGGTPAAAGGPATTASAADLAVNIPSTQAGVTDAEIRVASIGDITNIVGVDATQAPNGAQAYFDMVNSRGGIYGRQLVISERLDDQMTKNSEVVKKVVADNEVFAVLPVTTPLFLGAQELADAGIPTFGWLINREWSSGPGLYGHFGSFLEIEPGLPIAPFVAGKIGATRIGTVAYGVDQSKACADAVRTSFDKWGGDAEVVFTDDTIPFGTTDYSVVVQKIKDAGVDFVYSCVDNNGSVGLGRELVKQQARVPMFLNNAYEQDVVAKFGDVLDGAYVNTGFIPAETEPAPQGLQEYREWIAKVPGAQVGEQTMVGWINADLFYRALVAAGPAFTRQKVIDGANQIRDWTAQGLIAPVDWTVAHDKAPDPYCAAITKIERDAYTPMFSEPGKPLLCMSSSQPGPPQVTPTG